MTAGEWLASVGWFPVWTTFGGAAAVWASHRISNRHLRLIGVTLGAILSVMGCIALALFVVGLPMVPLLLGWAMFLASVVAKASEGSRRLQFVLAALVLALPLWLLGVVIVGSMSGRAS